MRARLGRTLIVLAAGCLLGVSAVAQAPSRVLSLDDALALARQQSAPVLLADVAVDGAVVEQDRVSALRWPTVDVFAGSGLNYGLTFDQTVGAVTRDAVRLSDISVQAEYTLFDGYERRALAAVADRSLRVAEFGQAVAQREAVIEVLLLYFDIAQAQASLEITTADLRAQRELLAETRAQVDVGARAEFELAQQRERVASARGDSLDLIQARALVSNRLVRILRLDPMATYTFAVPDAPVAADDLTATADSVIIAQAWELRADVRAADSRVEAAIAGERVAAAGAYPTVSIIGAFGSTYSSANEAGFLSQVGENRAGAASLRLQVPLLDRGAVRSLRAQSRLETEQRRVEADEARRAVALEVREARADLQRARVRLRVTESQVLAAQVALDAEIARYETGLTTVQAVSLVRARLVEALTEQAQLILSLRFGDIRLRLAAGEALGE